MEYKYNHNHDPATGQFAAASGGGREGSGARLTPEAKAVSDRIKRDFFLRTGKQVRINSGTRSPESQADAMLGKRGDWGIYKDQQAVAEIRVAQQRSAAAKGTRKKQVAEMAKVIRGQMSRGVYISDHLKSHALDLSVRDLSSHERAILVEISKNHGKKVLDERNPPHVHLKY